MSLLKSRLLVSFLYLLLIITGAYLAVYLPEANKMIKLLIIDVLLTIVIFLQSALLRNASMYDLYWSLIPFFFLFYWLYEYQVENLNYRMMAAILLLSIWSWRLSLNWYRGWKGLSHEDWRYSDLRKKTGVFYPFFKWHFKHFTLVLALFLDECVHKFLAFQLLFSSMNCASERSKKRGIRTKEVELRNPISARDRNGIPRPSEDIVDSPLRRPNTLKNVLGLESQ